MSGTKKLKIAYVSIGCCKVIYGFEVSIFEPGTKKLCRDQSLEIVDEWNGITLEAISPQPRLLRPEIALPSLT